jgi:glycosyltransferase involved in cell wall biosynthesis
MLDLVRIAAVGIALVGLAFWSTTLAVGIVGARRLRDLARIAPPAPPLWPRVSVVVPACNEIDTLSEAVRTHLHTSYPNLELILVDDRSTDGTGELIDALAKQDRRVRPLHVRRLPDGWLGKVHALHVGSSHANGQWLLFTDADVHIAAGTLEKAVALCEVEDRDLLTVIPRFLPVGPFVDAATTAMARAVFGGGQVWRAEDPAARQVAGFGAFILVRRTAFERSAGFEALRMEIADDLGIGLVVKEAGGRLAVVTALDHVSLRFYGSLSQMRSSIEKGSYGIIGRYRIGRLLVACAASLLMELGPFVAFVPVGVPWLPMLGAAGVTLALSTSAAAAWWMGRPLLSGLLFPVGVFLNVFFSLRSGVVGWRNGGIRWRGTFYPADQLRRGQRVQWP